MCWWDARSEISLSACSSAECPSEHCDLLANATGGVKSHARPLSLQVHMRARVCMGAESVNFRPSRSPPPLHNRSNNRGECPSNRGGLYMQRVEHLLLPDTQLPHMRTQRRCEVTVACMCVCVVVSLTSPTTTQTSLSNTQTLKVKVRRLALREGHLSKALAVTPIYSSRWAANFVTVTVSGARVYARVTSALKTFQIERSSSKSAQMARE